jgi:hypothetical protein
MPMVHVSLWCDLQEVFLPQFPSVPDQSLDQMKNFPSWETAPMAYWAGKLAVSLVVAKVWQNRQTLPEPSVDCPTTSSSQASVMVPLVVKDEYK